MGNLVRLRSVATGLTAVLVLITGSLVLAELAPAPMFKKTIGGPSVGIGEFDDAFGIDVDAAGNVYVADRFANRIQKFDNNGIFIRSWGAVGFDNGEFLQPSDVADRAP